MTALKNHSQLRELRKNGIKDSEIESTVGKIPLGHVYTKLYDLAHENNPRIRLDFKGFMNYVSKEMSYMTLDRNLHLSPLEKINNPGIRQIVSYYAIRKMRFTLYGTDQFFIDLATGNFHPKEYYFSQ